MLSPQEISEKKFVKAVFGGYDMTEVDDFLAELGTDYAALYKENAILKGKLKILVEKVEEYRSTEDAMRMALLTAQRTGDEIMSDANKRKEDMMREVEAERQKMLSDMKHRLLDEENKLAAAQKETAKFIEFSQTVIKKHSEFLAKIKSSAIPSHAVSKAKPPKPAAAPAREEQIMQSAAEINGVMEKIASSFPDEPIPAYDSDTLPAPASTVYDDESEPTKLYNASEREETLTPRPKFDFDDLKFGPNFDLDK